MRLPSRLRGVAGQSSILLESEAGQKLIEVLTRPEQDLHRHDRSPGSGREPDVIEELQQERESVAERELGGKTSHQGCLGKLSERDAGSAVTHACDQTLPVTQELQLTAAGMLEDISRRLAHAENEVVHARRAEPVRDCRAFRGYARQTNVVRDADHHLVDSPQGSEIPLQFLAR